jgi:hypothetical protein
MNAVRHFLTASTAIVACGLVGWFGCGGGRTSSPFTFGNGPDGDGGGGSEEGGINLTPAGSDAGSSGGGAGLVLMLTADGGVVSGGACTNGGSTTISGKIYDPAGKDALYGAVAYVPSKPVTALQLGATCDTCDSLYTGSPIAAAQTDATGSFTIQNAPSGTDIPLVIQLGKWRKQLKISTVKSCEPNPQPDKSLTLPANHMEGDIPNIAVSTGGADTLECLLLRMGVDPAEYEPGAMGPGRIHIFAGGTMGTFFGLTIGASPNTSPPGPASSAGLWNSDADIDDFDIVMLSCEGSETTNMDQQVLFDYAAKGGRVFASHFHYAWFNSGPFAAAANLATWTTGANPVGNGNINAVVQQTLLNGGPFAKGVAMEQWLGTVGALGVNGAPAGELPIVQAKHNANLSTTNVASTSWIVPDPKTTPAPSAGTTLYFSFNTPLGTSTENQCGRVVFSDLHIGGGSMDTGGTVPGECATGDLSPQEKALEFMLFDLSACVVPDNAPPPMLMIVPQ